MNTPDDETINATIAIINQLNTPGRTLTPAFREVYDDLWPTIAPCVAFDEATHRYVRPTRTATLWERCLALLNSHHNH